MENNRKNKSDLNRTVEKAFGVQPVHEKPASKPSKSNKDNNNDNKKH